MFLGHTQALQLLDQGGILFLVGVFLLLGSARINHTNMVFFFDYDAGHFAIFDILGYLVDRQDFLSWGFLT